MLEDRLGFGMIQDSAALEEVGRVHDRNPAATSFKNLEKGDLAGKKDLNSFLKVTENPLFTYGQIQDNLNLNHTEDKGIKGSNCGSSKPEFRWADEVDMAIELEEGPIAGDCEDRRGYSNDRGKKPMQARPDLASIPEHPRIARDHASNGETSKDSDLKGKGVVNNGRQDNDNRREVPRAWGKPKHVPLILNEEKTNFVKEDGLVTLNLEEARNNVSKLDKAIVGRLLGRRLPFWVVQNEIQRKWGHLGFIQVTPMGVDCFLCWLVQFC